MALKSCNRVPPRKFLAVGSFWRLGVFVGVGSFCRCLEFLSVFGPKINFERVLLDKKYENVICKAFVFNVLT